MAYTKEPIDITNISQLGEIYPEVVQDILDTYGRGKEFSLSFMPEVDKKLWGLKRKTLVTVGARPSNGKSTMLLNMAYDFSVNQKKSGILFTFEMTRNECVKRIIANHADIDGFQIMSGLVAREWELYADKIATLNDKIKDIPLHFVECHGRTFDSLFAIIENFSKVSPIDYVMIDYAQMIKTPARQDLKQAIDQYIVKLREYAIKRNFLAVIASQINRSTYDGKKVTRPMLHELKQTGGLEEVSDIVFLLHYPYFYSHEDDDRLTYDVQVAKNRNGRTGLFKCKYEANFHRITQEDGDGFPNMARPEVPGNVRTETEGRKDLDA